MISNDQNKVGELDSAHARDHLANERTFLAWIRTSLGIVGLGFVVVKFSLFVREVGMMVERQVSRPPSSYPVVLGTILVAVGVLMTFVAFIRFKQTQRFIKTGRFVQTSWPLRLLTGLLVISGVVMILYLIETS